MRAWAMSPMVSLVEDIDGGGEFGDALGRSDAMSRQRTWS